MMQLVRYEFNKLFHKRIIFFLLFLLLGLNLFFFVRDQKTTVYYNTPQYRELTDRYTVMKPQQAQSELTVLNRDYSLISIIIYYRSTGSDETALQNQIQFTLDTYPGQVSYEAFVLKYAYFLENPDEFKAVHTAVMKLLNQFDTILSYPLFIDSMKDKAEVMENVSVFAKRNTFAYRNIQKTVRDFDDLKGLPLKTGQEEGIMAVSDFPLTDYFLIAFILLLAILLFAEERENGLLTILKPTAHGRLKLAGSKFITLLCSTVVLSALFYGCNFAAATARYGLGDTGRFIQSMAGFRDVQMPMTVAGYLIALFLLKLLALLLFAAITALLFTVAANTKLTFVLLGGILACSYLAYFFIYPTSYLNPLKYLNLFSFLDSYQMIAYYNNLNLFGYPVSRLSSSVALAFLLTVLCSLAYLKSFCHTENRVGLPCLSLFKRRDPNHLAKGSVRLLSHELYKLFFSNKVLLLLPLALLLGLQNIDLSELLYIPEQYAYEYYANQLAGRLTEEKAAFVNEEQQRFDHIPEELASLAEKYDNHEITKNEYKGESISITEFAKTYVGFQRTKQQYDTLADLQKRQNIPVHFISEVPTVYLFDDSGRDLLLGLFYSVLLILCLCNLYCGEYKNGMIQLIRTTKNGRRMLFFKKASLAYAVAAVLMILLYIPIYITLVSRYHFTDWAAPIQSVLKYGEFPFRCSILQFILLVSVMQLITAFAMTNVLLLLAQLLKKQTFTILTGLLALSVPTIFRYIVPSLFHRYTFADGFTMYGHFSEQNSSLYAGLYTTAMLLIGILATVMAYRRFCNHARH